MQAEQGIAGRHGRPRQAWYMVPGSSICTENGAGKGGEVVADLAGQENPRGNVGGTNCGVRYMVVFV